MKPTRVVISLQEKRVLEWMAACYVVTLRGMLERLLTAA